MIKLLIKILIISLAINACDSCQSSGRFRGMKSSQPASCWQDALISGNGKMGVLVFGDTMHDTVILNHEFCYEPVGTEDIEPPDISKYLKRTREIFLEGRYNDAYDYSITMAREEGYENIMWTDPYHPALQMIIHQEFDDEVSDYKRMLDFETGEIDVTWSAGISQWSRKAFVSRPDNIIIQQISGDESVSCSIQISRRSDVKNKRHAGLDELQIKEEEITVDSDWLLYRQAYRRYGRGYESITRVIVNGGRVSAVDNTLLIDKADDVMLLTRINYLEDFDESLIGETQTELLAIEADYDELLAKHFAVHGEIFNRVNLDLFAGKGRGRTSEEMIADQKIHPNNLDQALLESMFDMGRYALLSASGENPPNLAGIWNGEWRPDWSGDFTLDANVNLQISSPNIGSMPEAIESYMKMIRRISPDWEINARKLYGCRGYVSGTRTSGRRNLNTHFSPRFPGHFWLAGAGWLLLPAYEYYLVSGDRKFLEETLLPMMKKIVLFFEDFLTVFDENGKYVFVPSYSPENYPSNIPRSPAIINATMDIAVAKEAIGNLITICKELGLEQSNIPKWENMLQKLPPYLVNDDGALKEWAFEGLEDRYNHRHVSHLYPVWPGLEINPEETPELFKAAGRAAEMRGHGDGSALGLSHIALIGARLKNDELVYGNLLFLLKNDYIYRGLFTSHNPGRIYNSDALCSIPAIILEMLVYSRPGVIELLPACSENFEKGRITGVGCRTMATVESLEWNHQEKWIKVTINSLIEQQVDLMFRRGMKGIRITGGEILEKKNSNTYVLALTENRPATLKIEME